MAVVGVAVGDAPGGERGGDKKGMDSSSFGVPSKLTQSSTSSVSHLPALRNPLHTKLVESHASMASLVGETRRRELEAAEKLAKMRVQVHRHVTKGAATAAKCGSRTASTTVSARAPRATAGWAASAATIGTARRSASTALRGAWA